MWKTVERDVLNYIIAFIHRAKGTLLVFDHRTGSLTVTLARVEGDVAESTSIFVPASAKVNASVEPVLDEEPSCEN